MIPKTASVKVSVKQQGCIKIKKVEGAVVAKTYQGDINIHGTVESVTAKTTYGTIKIKVKELPATSSLFLEAFKGYVELTLPHLINANLTARTAQGTVTSTVPITTTPQTIVLNKESWARFKKEALGTLGQGGAPITIEATKGNITIGTIAD